MSARAEIEELLYRYASGFDDDDLDLLAGCFTEDAHVEAGVGTVSGRAAIRDAYQARRDDRTAAGEQTRHVVTNVVIELVDDDHARSRSYYTLIVTGAAGSKVGSAGTYTDELVRTGGRWLIAERRSRGDARS
jgi:uncharacterized protein (TIGR02246 family)